MSEETNVTTTEEETEVIPASLDDIASLIQTSERKHDLAKARDVVGGQNFLPYISLYGGSSKIVKEGKFTMGHFGLMKNSQLIDLGDNFIGLFCAWRAKAMQMRGKIKAYFDVDSVGFKDAERRSAGANSGFAYGSECLIYMPDHGFVAYFLNNPTSRRESPNMLGPIDDIEETGIVPKLRIRSHLIDDGKNTWHGPSTEKYDLDIPIKMDLTKFQDVIREFNNPKDSVLELAETENEDADDRA